MSKISNKQKSCPLPLTSTDWRSLPPNCCHTVSRLPCERPSRSRESSAPNTSVSITGGGRKKRKMIFYPKIHFTSDLQTLIYSKPTKGLSSHRKPKPFLPKTINGPPAPPHRPGSLSSSQPPGFASSP